MRKYLALICVLALCLGGCSLPFQNMPATPQEDYVDALKYTDEFKNNLQYQQLDEREQHAYGQIYTSLRDCEETDSTITDANGAKIPGVRIPLSDARFTHQQMANLFETFFCDNPRFFYLDRTYSLEGYELNGETVYDTLLLQFTMDTEQRIQGNAALQRAMNVILAEAPQTEDDYEMELYLHDRLLSSCVYDNQAATSSSDAYVNAYSAYGALVEGTAVCEGYAKAMQLLLNAVSIPNTVVLGNAADDNEAHMWNLVRINGNYYYLDPTWNDGEGDHIQHTYFNITSEMLLRTHIPEENAFLVECTVYADNYHYRSGTYIDTYERDVIAKAIASRLLIGDTDIELRFADGKYENALLFLKDAAFTKKTVNKYLSGKTMWEYELHTQSKQGTITIRKK